MSNGDSKPRPDFTIDEFWEEVIEPGVIFYDGPGGFTIKEMADAKEYSESTVRRKVKRALDGGAIVRAQRTTPFGPVNVYVKREVYEDWISQNIPNLSQDGKDRS